MKRVILRREQPKRHRMRNTAIAVGAVGAATAGVHRWRRRHHNDEVPPPD